MKCPNCNAEVTGRFCSYCGCEMPREKHESVVNGNVVINNYYKDSKIEPTERYLGKKKDKILALCLCIFLGFFGAHKFYEEKIFLGFLYSFTCGLFGIGWIIDIFALLFKPNPYYVR